MIKFSGIQVLEFGIRLSIFEEPQEDLARLHWPTSLNHFKLLGLRILANTPSESAPRNAAFLLHDIFQVPLRIQQSPALQSVRCIECVFEVNTQVTTLCFARFAGIFWFRRIFHHCPGTAAHPTES